MTKEKAVEELKVYAKEMHRLNKEHILTIKRLESEIRALRGEQVDAVICPFMNNVCVEKACRIYNPKLNDCSIQPLTYNLYRLNNLIEEQCKRSETFNNVDEKLFEEFLKYSRGKSKEERGGL